MNSYISIPKPVYKCPCSDIPQYIFVYPTRFPGDVSNKRTSKLGTTED